MQKVGVIIPAYNAARFIKATLDSILVQKRMPNEVIVVDDGSTDGTADIVQQHSLNASGLLKIIIKKNEGVAAARNTGILASKSDWLVPLDADDVLKPNHIQDLMAHAEATNLSEEVGLIFGVAERFFDSPKTEFECRNLPDFRAISLSLSSGQLQPDLHELNRDVVSQLLTGNFIPSCGSIFRRMYGGTLRLYDQRLRYCEDRDFYLKIALSSKIQFLDRPVCGIYRHSTNASAFNNSYATTRAAISLLYKFTNSTDSKSLTNKELGVAKTELHKTIRTFLYSASVLGIFKYMEALKFLRNWTSTFYLINMRDLARAIYFSLKVNYFTKFSS